jgi:hypothetical protein
LHNLTTIAACGIHFALNCICGHDDRGWHIDLRGCPRQRLRVIASRERDHAFAFVSLWHVMQIVEHTAHFV